MKEIARKERKRKKKRKARKVLKNNIIYFVVLA